MIKNRSLVVSGEEKKCKYCDAPIIWVKSLKGKWYPVDIYGYEDRIAYGLKTRWHQCQKNNETINQ